ncbi:MAG: thioredoxin family protein, partial [Candidatus Melainabacteria bacterium]|nr:thioredoxin family protein [Candidatus Melainabacteria bacterium]
MKRELMKQSILTLLSASLVILLQVAFLCAYAADINWRSDIAAAAAEAKSTNRFMFVEISAPWCPACRKLEKLMSSNKIGLWTNPRFVSVHLSADAPGGKALMQKFGMRGIPALLVFDPNGKFKDKMSGAPSDVDGFIHFLTKMAGGEAAFASAASASGGNTSFPPQTEPWSGNGTAGGDYPTPQDSYPQANYEQAPPQQWFQSPPPQNNLPPSQQAYQQTAQPGFQSPPSQNYLPPAQYQQFSQPVMQWQGQQPPNPLFSSNPHAQQQPQQFQPASQQYSQPQQQYPQPQQQYPQPQQQYPQPQQQYPQPQQQYP